ncbi:MAG: DNA polymerase I [Eubacterium sp.]|jgi:DNA polymerase-1
MSDKIVLIDGHSILNRAFFAIPDLTNSEGLHTNAVYGFLNILFKILEEEQPQYLTVAFDRSEPTFRHKMYQEYKGTRKPMAEELHQQVPVIKDLLRAMDVEVVELPGYEADDILGTIARIAEEKDVDVRIISGDRDLLQLATDRTMIRIPKTKRTGTEIEDYLAQDVMDRYQVTPEEFIDVKALMGDSSDNIPGVPGIGEKTATKLIVRYHSIENAYAHLDEISQKRAQNCLKEHYDMAELSKTLATIDRNAPVEFSLEEARMGSLYTEEAYPIMKRLEFKQFLPRFEGTPAYGNAEEKFRRITGRQELQEFLDGLDPETAAVQIYQKPEPAGGSRRGHRETAGQQTLDFSGTEMSEGCLYGAAFGDGTGQAAFVPAGSLTEAEIREEVRRLADRAIRVISPDLKQLIKFACRIPREKAADTSIAAYLLNPLKNAYAYDDIASDYLGEMIPSEADLFGKMKREKAQKEKPEAFEKMACYEVYTAAKANGPLMDALKEQDMMQLYREIELPLVYTLADMELEGVRVDGEALHAYGEQLIGRIQELEQEIYKLADETFNIQSPKQLGTILFEKLQMPYAKKTKTGYSTAADVLEKLAPEYPIAARVLEYRTLTKLKSTYADGLAGFIRADGRIHSSFNQTITATGRISSTDPNLQNIPIRMELGRMIRKVFIPREGSVLIDADYSQIELRILAHMSKDKNLISAYRQSKDIHRITASLVFHTPFEEVTPLQRRNAKAVNFGIVYGISSFGLSQDLSISRKEAQEYIASYFATYPGIKIFLDQAVEDAKEKGYSVTMFGRRRPVPELKSGNFAQRQFGERIAMNSPIQGTAADIIKIAMIRVHDRLEREGLQSKLILQVHDELLIEAEQTEVDAVKKILEEEMCHAADLSVALEIDMKTGKNWYEAH